MKDEKTITPAAITQCKNRRKITMLTAYDYSTAVILDEAGVDIVLVGDSLANVALGLQSTREVGLEEMLYHAKAVCRGVKRALVLTDMPYSAYQCDSAGKNVSVAAALQNALRLKNDSACGALKIEWSPRCLELTEAVIGKGIAVCGHIGLTPQTADETGGFKTRGVSADEALNILAQAEALQKAGCFAVVMECVPEAVAGDIARKLSIPVIGIGAGRFCDGQVLVTNDMLGMNPGFRPRFVKRYADLHSRVMNAAGDFIREVGDGSFPAPENTFKIKPEELASFREKIT
ncbi:MAG: 3-methyl-2-oxobutanoate hydroxymethyltransferase [Candidatus Omnitrophota bacterium]